MPEGKAVQTMFGGIASRYDRANHWLSGGVDFWWRHVLVKRVAAEKPARVADLATGSGDVAFALKRKLGAGVLVEGYDFCEPMLAEAREKQARRPEEPQIPFAFGDCLALPLETGSVDVLTIAFGLRNLEDRQAGLREMLRVLRPGGCLCVLEFSQPAAVLRPFYYFYLRRILPVFARALTGDRDAYLYLGNTIAAFPTKDGLAAQIREAGFAEVRAEGLTGGIVALHRAWKDR